MKAKVILIAAVILSVIFLCGTGINPASAYDVTVKNTTNAQVNVVLIALSTWVFGGQVHSKRFFADPIAPNGGTRSFQVPVDSENLCPGYLEGWDSNWNGFTTMGCNGVENNTSTLTCTNLSFEVYKATDGTLHFRKK